MLLLYNARSLLSLYSGMDFPYSRLNDSASVEGYDCVASLRVNRRSGKHRTTL